MENMKLIQLKKALKEIDGYDVKRLILIASGDLPDGRQRDNVVIDGLSTEIIITVAINMIENQDARNIILKAAELFITEEEQLKKIFGNEIKDIEGE